MNILAKERLIKGIEDVHREAGGLLAIAVVRPADALDLIAAALSGDAEAMQLLDAINGLCDDIQRSPKSAPILCVSCPRPLNGSLYSFALAVPKRDDPTRMIGLGVCPHCAKSTEEITAKALTYLQEIWPNLRPVTVTHKHGGRA